MNRRLQGAIAGLALTLCMPAQAADDWQPPGPITLMIGFTAGGGADTQARLIAETLEETLGWTFLPENVTGKGGIAMLSALKDAPADGTVIGMAVTEALGYNMLAAEDADLSIDDFTPLTTTAAGQMGIVARSDSGYETFEDVVAAARDGRSIRFGVMSPKLADLAYLLGKAHDIEFNTVMHKGGKAVVDAVNAGDVDIGWAAGIQSKAVAAGDMINLASGLSTPLAMSPEAPTLADLGVPFDAGTHFLFVAPAGLPEEARTALADALSAVVEDPDTKAGGLIAKAFGGAAVVRDGALDAMIVDVRAASEALMRASAE